MPIDDLRKLWKLHLVDLALHEIRKRAAGLDPGRKIQAELAALTQDFEQKSSAAKVLTTEQTDAELHQKSIDDKLKRIDKDMYGGKVVNPREVEALEREIAILKKQRGDIDVRLLELWEEIPPTKKLAEEAAARVAEKKKELDEYQKNVIKFKHQLESEFKERSEKRPGLAKEVPASLLARYEAIKQRQGGIGMAEVTKKGACGGCGTQLPTKVVENAKEGNVVTCEACHRIIYASEGLI